MGKVIVFGSMNMDLSIACDRMPQAGETLTGRDFLLNPGGKGANQAVAAARLGASVGMIAAVGADLFGDELVAGLVSAGVDCAQVRRVEGVSTGVASITRAAGDNRIVLDPGANRILSADDARTAIDAMAQAGDVFVTQLECDRSATFDALSHARDRGLFTIFNPAPAGKIPDGLWPSIDMVCLNETECEIVTGIFPGDVPSARRALDLLAARGAGAAALTLGSKGSLVLAGEHLIESVPPAVDAVDTTGAGDTYIGALAAGRAAGLPFDRTIELATCASALSTTRLGAQRAIPRIEEVEPWVASRA